MKKMNTRRRKQLFRFKKKEEIEIARDYLIEKS